MEQQIIQLNERLTKLERQLGGLSNDVRQVQVIRNAVKDMSFDSIRVDEFGIGKTPVTPQASISDPSGGAVVDTEARSAINSILNVLDAFGLTQ